MSRVHVFGDESGNFDFSRNRGATRYFILTTVAMEECMKLGTQLQELRHQMAWEKIDHPGPFHANHDPWPVRQRVFQIIAQHDLAIDTLILEKAKAQPQVRKTPERFYQTAWFYLMRHVAPRFRNREMLVVSASIGQKKMRMAFHETVCDVMQQVGGSRHVTACWDCSSDPCLQVADYCGWAIQRKWESGDPIAHDLVRTKIRSEYNLFSVGGPSYY